MAAVAPRQQARRVPSADGPTGAAGSEIGAGSLAVIMDFVPMTTDEYDRVVEEVELSRTARRMSSPVFHWVREYPDGIRVIEIWPALEPLTSFIQSVLRPVLRDLRLPEPKLTFHDVPDYLTASEDNPR